MRSAERSISGGRLWALLALGLLGLGLTACSRGSAKLGTFDSRQVAAAEARLWQAYYGSDPARLRQELAAMVSRQFQVPEDQAGAIAEDFALAAARFAIGAADPDSEVVASLESGYGRLRSALGLGFDPAAAGRAELAWWVARRTPGQDAPVQVGDRIAELYGILYDRPAEHFQEAGRLRAQAAALRDAGGARCDWAEVERLLGQSYAALARAL